MKTEKPRPSRATARKSAPISVKKEPTSIGTIDLTLDDSDSDDLKDSESLGNSWADFLMQPQLDKMFSEANGEDEDLRGQMYADLLAHIVQKQKLGDGLTAKMQHTSDDEQDPGMEWDEPGPAPRPPSSSLLSASPQVPAGPRTRAQAPSGGGSMVTRAKAARLGVEVPPINPPKPDRAPTSLRPVANRLVDKQPRVRPRPVPVRAANTSRVGLGSGLDESTRPRFETGSSRRAQRVAENRLAHLVDRLEGARKEMRELLDGRRRELETWERVEEVLTLVLEEYGQ